MVVELITFSDHWPKKEGMIFVMQKNVETFFESALYLLRDTVHLA